MFFYNEPAAIQHVTSNLKLYLEPNINNNITLLNGAVLGVSGGIPQYTFDGVNDYATLTGSLNGLPSRAFTISMWIRSLPNTINTSHVVLSNTSYSTIIAGPGVLMNIFNGFQITLQNGLLSARIDKLSPNGWIQWSDGNRQVTSHINQGRLDDNQFHNIVVTSAGGTPYSTGFVGQDLNLYVNGVRSVDNSKTTTYGNCSLWNHSSTMILGAGAPLSAFRDGLNRLIPSPTRFKGAISIAQFYTASLNETEIIQNYNAFKQQFGR